jgi:hypothetical protein
MHAFVPLAINCITFLCQLGAVEQLIAIPMMMMGLYKCLTIKLLTTLFTFAF